MPSKKELSQAVANLISSGFSTVPDQPHIKCEDIYPSLRPYFTDKAAKALYQKTNHMLHQRNELVGHEGLVGLLAKLNIKKAKQDLSKHGYIRVIDMVNFLGLRADQQGIAEAASKVILAINDLAERGYITAAMAPLSIIELDPSAGPDRFLVVSYLAIKQAGQMWVDTNLQDLTFKEGGMPNDVKDVK
jgi:hypothetical protein